MMIIFSFSLSHLLLKRKKERRKPKQKRIGAAAVDERRADELVITSPPGNVLPPPGCIKNASVADPVRYINSRTASNFGQKKKSSLSNFYRVWCFGFVSFYYVRGNYNGPFSPYLRFGGRIGCTVCSDDVPRIPLFHVLSLDVVPASQRKGISRRRLCDFDSVNRTYII